MHFCFRYLLFVPHQRNIGSYTYIRANVTFSGQVCSNMSHYNEQVLIPVYILEVLMVRFSP